jgi:glutaconyl-CoA/methylmalonyl-CoA decarboxylase subunit delta
MSGPVEANEVILMGHPVTTNPFIIMLINMTVVFAVLIGLSFMICLIHVVDPTKKAEEKPTAAPTPAAAPVAAAPVADNSVVIAVISAAVAAYGYSAANIIAIRPAGNAVWKNAGRMAGIQNSVN